MARYCHSAAAAASSSLRRVTSARSSVSGAMSGAASGGVRWRPAGVRCPVDGVQWRRTGILGGARCRDWWNVTDLQELADIRRLVAAFDLRTQVIAAEWQREEKRARKRRERVQRQEQRPD